MSKEKKQTPQQSFNQFLFEEMANRLTDVKAYEKEVAEFGEQVSQHISDHEENEVRLVKFYAELIAKVEALEANLDSHAHTGLMQRITKLERVHKWESSGLVALSKVEAMDQNLAAHHERMNRHDTRISDLEETAESLSETVDQPSTCKCEAGNQMLKRILKLEDDRKGLFPHTHQPTEDKISEMFRLIEKTEEEMGDILLGVSNRDHTFVGLSQRVEALEAKSNHIEAENHSLLNGNYERRIEKLENTPATSLNTAIIANHSKRIGELEEANAALWEAGTEQDAVMLSQLKAIEKFNEALVLRLNIGAAALADLVDDIRTLQLQMKEQREDYHAHIRQLVEENEAAYKRFVQSQQEQNASISTLKKQVSGMYHVVSKHEDTVNIIAENTKTLVRDVEALKLQMKNILPKPRIKKGTASCQNDEKEY